MKYFFYRSAIVLCILLYVATISYGQDNNATKLGLDNSLYNGKYYTYFVSKDIKGDQFIKTKVFTHGKIWKNEVEFDSILLNYDVYNQDLILKFNSREGALKLIAISMANLDSFLLDNKLFIINRTITDDYYIFNKVEYKHQKFLIHYSKELVLKTKLNDIQYEFNKLISTMHYSDGKKYYLVNNNHGLLRVINQDKKKEVKAFLKSKKYKLQKMSEPELLELLILINNDIDDK
ncbi:MAG: hypothetical protein DRI86_12480 [Bacteroidetes bacterium]|nr:MAG: hypothetical protein DRI86_12480 [Bacteroidota bacterium]